MSATPEPPAPTPSATTDPTPRAGCAATFVSKEQCELPAGHAGPHRSHSLFPPTMGAPFEWGHDRIPPASAPAATAGTERCRIIRAAGVCNELTVAWVEWFADRTRQRLCAAHADHVQKAALGTVAWDGRPSGEEPETIRCAGCGRECEPIADDDSPVTHCVDCYRPAAPTGEEAETLKALRDAADILRRYSCRPLADDLDAAAARLTAQATELAALRARVEELEALLRRIVAWNDDWPRSREFWPEALADARAALAPRQPEESAR